MRATIVPSLSLDRMYFMTFVAILGTTISPYLFFWQAAQEVEEERAQAAEGAGDPGPVSDLSAQRQALLHEGASRARLSPMPEGVPEVGQGGGDGAGVVQAAAQLQALFVIALRRVVVVALQGQVAQVVEQGGDSLPVL